MAYSTDLTLEEFKLIEPLLPKPYLVTRPPIWTKHQILNGILYQMINGCKWVDLPKDFPPSGTVYYWFNKWKQDGVWEELASSLFVKSRLDKGKKKKCQHYYS
jgi:transposase